MSSRKQHAKWWQVYIMVPVLLGLFWPETRASLSQSGHVVAELGILALIFGSVRWWLRANRSALMVSDASDAGWGVRIREIPRERLRDMEEAEERLNERPVLEIAGADSRGIPADSGARNRPEDVSGVFAQRGTVS